MSRESGCQSVDSSEELPIGLIDTILYILFNTRHLDGYRLGTVEIQRYNRGVTAPFSGVP